MTDDNPTRRISTLTEVIEQHITPALGNHAADYDLEGIARATYTWTVDHDHTGAELLNTAGFEQTVTGDAFWEIVKQHDLSA